MQFRCRFKKLRSNGSMELGLYPNMLACDVAGRLPGAND